MRQYWTTLRETPPKKSKPRPTKNARTIQHLKEVQKEAGMFDLRNKHTSGLY